MDYTGKGGVDRCTGEKQAEDLIIGQKPFLGMGKSTIKINFSELRVQKWGKSNKILEQASTDLRPEQVLSEI